MGERRYYGMDGWGWCLERLGINVRPGGISLAFPATAQLEECSSGHRRGTGAGTGAGTGRRAAWKKPEPSPAQHRAQLGRLPLGDARRPLGGWLCRDTAGVRAVDA